MGIIKPMPHHIHRDQKKSKIVLILFLEAPFLRGFYFAKMDINTRKPYLKENLGEVESCTS
jgi:hypothetical protein